MKRRRLLLALAVPLVASVAAFARQSKTESEEEAVRLVGICSFTESSVACWNPKGEPDAVLTAVVDRGLGASSSNRLQIQYGLKNRLLVFARGGDGYASVQYRTPGGDNLSSGLQIRDDLSPRMDVVFVATVPERRTGDVEATVTRYRPTSGVEARLAPKPGTTASAGGFAFRVRSVDAKPTRGVSPYARSRPGSPPKPRDLWRIVVEVTPPDGVRANYSAQPYAPDGALILAADDRGRPAPPPKPDANGVPRDTEVLSLSASGLGASGESPRELALLSAVDPARLGEVRIGISRIEGYRFEAIPLDPRAGNSR